MHAVDASPPPSPPTTREHISPNIHSINIVAATYAALPADGCMSTLTHRFLKTSM